jgi:hypothetical protein
VRAAQLRGELAGVEEPILAVSAPSLVQLGDGRTVFIAVASEGRYHAAEGLGIAAIVDERRPEPTPLFAMPGHAPRGEAPTFNAPREQPGHIWSAVGDISFGDSEGWAGVADLAGSLPRELGRFRTHGRHLCAIDELDPRPCQGGWEYVVTSVAYAPAGQLRLQWRMEEFDQLPSAQWWNPHKVRVRARELTAAYELRDGRYALVSGQEPPSIP